MPPWLESLESLKAEAAVYEQKVPALLARTGALVTGAVEGTWITDRSTGEVLLRAARPFLPGDVVKVQCGLLDYGGTRTPDIVCFRVLRPADYSEVCAMAAKWGGERPLTIHPGHWYLVLTD